MSKSVIVMTINCLKQLELSDAETEFTLNVTLSYVIQEHIKGYVHIYTK
jgi:hypothetical protein